MPKVAKLRTPVKVDLPSEVDRKMEIQAARLGLSKREFVEAALREYIKSAEKRPEVFA